MAENTISIVEIFLSCLKLFENQQKQKTRNSDLIEDSSIPGFTVVYRDYQLSTVLNLMTLAVLSMKEVV